MNTMMSVNGALCLLLLLGFCQGFSVVLEPSLTKNIEFQKARDADIFSHDMGSRWTSSIVTLPDRRASPALWNRLVPKLWEDARSFDSTRVWTSCSCRHDSELTATRQAMHEWINAAFPITDESVKLQCAAELASFAEAFVNAVRRQQLEPQAPRLTFKARIVASRGSVATKCPRWHVDHVFVRHIQSLVGPGCAFMESTDEDWSGMQARFDANDDSLTTEEWNRQLIGSKACTRQVSEGQAAFLVGNRWKEFAGYELAPCVHRSPQGLKPWEGRVLFTIDIVDDA
ncbi:hypothetical protein MPSEU_000436600 [Mayamaea pseudoterrestris]|nr:hypothetical protein MPSEU_000436600 [Mayamaea pseudoterrestris]